MPIYEYLCRQCDNRFETLVRAAEAVACPSCGGVKLEKQLSVFSQGSPRLSSLTSTPMSRSEVAACGMCGDPRGPGACSMD